MWSSAAAGSLQCWGCVNRELNRLGLETMDDTEHAAALTFAEGEDSRAHPMVYPGTYLCRFERNTSIVQPSLNASPRS